MVDSASDDNDEAATDTEDATPQPSAASGAAPAVARRALAAQIASSVAAATPGRKSRKGGAAPAEPEAISPSQGGMGLGFFIARTLLERTGGKVFVGAGDGGKGQPKGARVAVRWPRPALEVPS